MKMDVFKDRLIKIDQEIFEVEGLPGGEYDGQADKYDKLISNGFYNRIMWGNSPDNYSGFCKEGLESSNNGIVADIGCGTLSFTYKVYAESKRDDLFLCDLSLEMLKIGRERIHTMCDDSSTFTFLRSDALNMPFEENTVQTILCFGILHIFNTPSDLVKEIFRILKPGGKLYMTSLCSDRKFSGRYLNLLHKKGHVAKPLKSSEIRTIVENNGIEISDFRIIGGMAYITGMKKPGSKQ